MLERGVPKVVDHDQRREELARAVWAVIARAGVEGATVRAVAAEAGWSMGALRYYFATQDGLLRFALEVMLRRTPERLRSSSPAANPASNGRNESSRNSCRSTPTDSPRGWSGWLS